ncbi:MAG: delta-60 repeat domain-containing protein [Opitutaceae bacterium]
MLPFLASLRRLFSPAAVLALLAVFGSPPTRAGTDAFAPNLNGTVFATALQPDGKLIVGGGFTLVRSSGTVQDTAHFRIARLNTDGSVDASFDVHLDGDVTAIALQRDGRIVIGGKFQHVRSSNESVGPERRGLARLNPDGTLDTGFIAHADGGPAAAPAVSALAVQPDGRILVAGYFTTLQTAASPSPVARRRLARLNPDGSLDLAFNPSPNNAVLALLIQRDGRIVVGGGFTAFQPDGATDSITRTRLARLNPDGSLDPDFQPKANNRVLALAAQADDALLVGGDFRTLQGAADEYATARNFLGRLNTDGSLDTTFDPSASASVAALVQLRDGRILAGGSFTTFRPSAGNTIVSRRYLARLLADGSIDDSFAPTPNAAVNAFSLQPDGQVLVGGAFTALRPGNDTTATPRHRIARLLPNGALDGTFSDDTGVVGRVLRQPDGKLLVSGSFNRIAGVTRRNLARLNADGTLDQQFVPTTDGGIEAMVLQSDGRIVIGGSFTTVNDVSRTYLARLNADGTLDTSFHPQPGNVVYGIVLQSDGRLLVGGAFTTFDPDDNDDTAVVTRNYLARITTDGSLDDSFQPGAAGTILALVLQADGKLLLGGTFTSLTGHGGTTTARNYLGRLKADGTLDDTFNPSPNATVQAIALQADGAIVISGLFSTLNPGASTTVEAVSRNRIARIKSDGTLDTGFNLSPDGSISTILAHPSGQIYLGGTFTAFNLLPHYNVARLNADGSIDAGFTLSANASVVSLTLDTNNRVLVGGAFTALQSATGAVLSADDHLARLDASGILDTAFVVRTGTGTGRIQALAQQLDGSILAGGNFTRLDGGDNQSLVRFTASGQLDTTFNPRVNGTVEALLVAPEDNDTGRGKLLAWLNRDGTLNRSFSLSATSQLSGQINAVAVQPDGRLLVAGSFTDKGAGAGSLLARYFPNGTVDTSFAPGPDGAVSALLLQPDGKILIGGAFVTVGGVQRRYVARLNPDGSIDTGFNPKANGQVNAFALLSDGRIVIGGAFTTLDPNSTDDADVDVTSRNYLARLNSDGTIDTSFNPGASAAVRSLLVQPDGRLLVGGAFATVGDQTRNGLARFNADGTLESTFNPNIGGTVVSIVLQSDGKLVIGGAFTTVNPNSTDSTTAVTRTHLARLNADGTLDSAFNPDPNNAVNAVVASADGGFYVAGAFTAFTPNGATVAISRNRVALIRGDGTVDTGFNPNANADALTLALLPNNTVLVGGLFTALHPDSFIWVGGSFSDIGGVDVPRLARLNGDGNADSSKRYAPDGDVHALLRQANGSVVVAGAFTAINGTPRTSLARFLASGTLDPTFFPAVNGRVRALALQDDGRLLIGGDFTQVGGVARGGLARLEANGAVDLAFAPAVTGRITALAVQPDGSLLLSGEFTRVAGQDQAYLARLKSDGSLDSGYRPVVNGPVYALALQSNGHVLVGGAFTHVYGVPRGRLAKFNLAGTLDPFFTPAADAEVHALAISAEGRAVLGGDFTTLDGRNRRLIAHGPAADPSTSAVAVAADLRTVTWSLPASHPRLTSVDVAYSPDGLIWTTLGSARATTAGTQWSLNLSASLPAAGIYYVRTRGSVPSSQQGSSSLIERVWQFYGTQPAGVANGPDQDSAEVATTTPAPADSAPGPSVDSSGSAAGSGSGAVGSTDAPATGTFGRLVNLSTRVSLKQDGVIITGFTVEGTEAQPVLLRAVGPGLSGFGVEGVMSRPKLELYDAQGRLLVAQEGWSPELASSFASAGAFPLATDSRDAALKISLPPGGYTVHARDAAGAAGVVLIEVYAAPLVGQVSHLGALSARGPVAAGADALIAGIVITGDAPRTMLVRGIGPGLASFGVADALSEARVTLFDSTGQPLAENAAWSRLPTAQAELASAASVVGAFPLSAGSGDAALLITLAPGSYTVQITGAAATKGSALIELYPLPATP